MIESKTMQIKNSPTSPLIYKGNKRKKTSNKINYSNTMANRCRVHHWWTEQTNLQIVTLPYVDIKN